MECLILIAVSVFVLALCDKNNSPEFLLKILYNNEFKEEDVSQEKRKASTKKSTSKKKSVVDDFGDGVSKDELMSNLDYSSEEELENFDASSIADELIDEIKSR